MQRQCGAAYTGRSEPTPGLGAVYRPINTWAIVALVLPPARNRGGWHGIGAFRAGLGECHFLLELLVILKISSVRHDFLVLALSSGYGHVALVRDGALCVGAQIAIASLNTASAATSSAR
jgi:hypothetical protein